MRIESGITIERDAAEVFAYVADFENNPKWQGGMISARWTSEPPAGVGSTYVQESRFLGRRIDTDFEVVAWDPPRRVKISSTSGTFPITVTRSVEAIEGRACRVSAVVEGDPNGVFRLFGPLLAWMVKRSVDQDYARLREILEQ